MARVVCESAHLCREVACRHNMPHEEGCGLGLPCNKSECGVMHMPARCVTVRDAARFMVLTEEIETD